ncbi:alpha/beta hydrolase [Pinisolibacter aquiterrae]|uniref:alpha/beta hydrolase n=1 Tax=Pinisolibacter aquiterrae TaxID=2815579 RepID=UPI001C3C44C3|nr:alpha/beta hydrolase [Pinisolibacter aquiterrae]MBV5265491.1 alpha/beta hydrolase [Pinisolibacter aquiterrae]MCC8236942.1 alpha/beta hydrolase [Pinisolibacter aquiterrae]
MSAEVETITVGAGAEARTIAVKRRSGRGPDLIWLGGFRSDMEGTKALALDAHAAARGLAFTRFDYSGHGVSSGRFEDGTISRWAEEAAAVFAATEGPQILIGSSMGGWMSLLTARAHLAGVGRANSRIVGMVLIAPAPDFTEALMWASFSEEIRRTILDEGRYAEPSAYSDEPYVITRALIEDGRRNLLLGGTIETGCPVAILQGKDDESVPVAHALRLTERLALDDATLTLVDDGDHRLSRPEDIDLLLRTVDEMIGRVG